MAASIQNRSTGICPPLSSYQPDQDSTGREFLINQIIIFSTNPESFKGGLTAPKLHFFQTITDFILANPEHGDVIKEIAQNSLPILEFNQLVVAGLLNNGHVKKANDVALTNKDELVDQLLEVIASHQIVHGNSAKAKKTIKKISTRKIKLSLQAAIASNEKNKTSLIAQKKFPEIL